MLLLLLLLPAEGPAVVAHRGLLRHAPENTLPAFSACLDLRLGLELDVRKSRDGHLVVIHDATVDRTTNGKGSVAELPLAELKKLDAGAWFAPAYAGERIPTLDEVFALVKARGHPGTLVLVDLKAEGIEADVIALAKKHGVLGRMVSIGTAIGSPAVRKTLREADKDAPVAVLANAPGDLKAALAAEDANWAYLRFVPDAAQRKAISDAGKKLLLVGPLFAGQESDNWKRAKDVAADAVLTDYPLECARVLREKKDRERR